MSSAGRLLLLALAIAAVAATEGPTAGAAGAAGQYDGQSNAQYISPASAQAPCGPRCVQDCPQVRIPICASDGALRLQFNNVCTLHAYNCRHGKHFEFLKTGTCYT